MPDGMVQGLLASVDCNVQTMARAGYAAISGPNSQVGLALTAMMTIYVAILGLRLLMGFAPLRIGEITLTVLKLGLVLAFATSWPTYQTVVFDTLFHGPEQLATSMLMTLQPEGSALGGNPFDALQVAFDQMQAGAAFFARLGSPAVSPLTGGTAFAALQLNLSSYLLLLTTAGVVIAAKIVLALLLALGPIFIALLLFESTRGVFEGWLRAAIGFALVPLFATFVLLVQLVLLEPSLIALTVMMGTNGKQDPAIAISIFLLTAIGAGVALAGLAGVGFVAAGFRLPQRAAPALARETAVAVVGGSSQTNARQAEPQLGRPRAEAVAAAAMAMERRDTRAVESAGADRRATLIAQTVAAPSTERSHGAGQAQRRRAHPGRGAASARRDR